MRKLCLALDRHEEALSSFDRALEIDSTDYQAWFNRGGALDNLGRSEEALESFDRALEIDSTDYRAWSNRGVALDNLGRHEEALESCDRALEIDSTDYQAWSNRGLALDHLGRHEEALESCDHVLAIKADFDLAWTNRSMVASHSRGCSYPVSWTLPPEMQTPALDQREHRGAVATLREGLKYVPAETEGWARLHHGLGRCHFTQGRIVFTQGRIVSERPYRYFCQAEKAFRKALQVLTPQSYPEAYLEVLSDYVRLLYHLDEPEQAEYLLREGSGLLQTLLESSQRSDREKQQLALKFNNFRQLTVQQFVYQQKVTEALITAEKDKNACLQWLLQQEWIDPNQLETPTLSEFQNQLDTSAAVIYWYLSPVALTTFIITANGGPQVLETENITNSSGFQQYQELEDFLKTCRQEQEEQNEQWQKALPKRLEQLETLLNIPNLVKLLPPDISQLILVPHRDLHRLPLHALFPEHLTVRYLPSLQMEQVVRETPLKSGQEQYNFLALEGDTKGDKKRPALVKLERSQVANYFERPYYLPHSSETVSWKEFGATLQQSQGVLHYCGHAKHNFKQPSQSQLVFNVVNEENQPEPLKVEQIYKLDLRAYQLVVLNACETGIAGNEEILTEYVGLGSTFLSSGVDCVVSTLWKVPDLAAFLVIKEFYRQVVEEGKPKPVALQSAVCHFRDMSSQQFHQTYAPVLKQKNEHLCKQELEEFLKRGDFTENMIQRFQENMNKKINNFNEDVNHVDVQDFQDPYNWAAFICQGT